MSPRLARSAIHLFVIHAAFAQQPATRPAPAGDSATIQAQLDKAGKQGGVVRLEARRYTLEKPLTVPSGVTLAGVWEAPHHAALTKGTVLEITAGKGDENAPPAITLQANAAVKGLTFFYPDQRLTTSAAGKLEVIPYPWTIQGRGDHCSVIDCTFVNPCKAIDFGTHGCPLHRIRDCYGCPLKIGIHVDQCYDIGRIENVHWNPHYWGNSQAPGSPKTGQIIPYLFDNLTAFEFARTDWEYVYNTFCYGAKVGYRFFATKAGTVNGNFLGIGADWCRRALLVEESQSPGLLITNGEFVGGEGTDAMIEVTPTHNGVMQLSNCAFWGPAPIAAIVAGPGFSSFSQCNFINHGPRKPGYHTLDIRGGDVIIQGCRFSVEMPDIRLGPKVQSAVINGNWFRGNKEITDETTTDNVAEGLNVSRKLAAAATRPAQR